ncbi:MAG: aldo/keto reductase [Xanthomonadales bacterium]|nr:aldo/keto reductase [Xanthomonadales bacterium]NIX12708.1 aldo/keto reductase [Xanthomonadales bacterium]
MEYRRLGKSGLKLSEFSFGSWVTFGRQVDDGAARDMMALAYDRGVNFFDNAEAYEHGQSEELMGRALQQLAWPRDSYCVSSKVFWGGDLPTQRGLSRKHVTEACHAALRRLRVDYLDLYFCHRPDIETPIEETVRAMHDLVSQGKVLYWGTSEWNAQQLTEAYAMARQYHLTPPTMEQPQYNLFCREQFERDLVPLFEDYGLGTTIWSPLASGILTGKYSEGIPEGSRMSLPGYGWLAKRVTSEEGLEQIEKTRRLQQLAEVAGLAVHHMALLWCLLNPHVSTVILGASRQAQLEDNLGALEYQDLVTPELLQRIEEIVDNAPKPPPQF